MSQDKEALAEVQKNAQVALREAEETIPYQQGVITQTTFEGNNPLLPSHTVELTLRFENPDRRPTARTLKITEEPPIKRHWTNLFERERRTVFYGEAPAPHGDIQKVIEVRRGEKVVYTCTQTSNTETTEGHLRFADTRALRRMAPFIQTLTTNMLTKFESSLPTQPL